MTSRLAVTVLLLASGATVLLGQAPQRADPTFRVQVDAVEFDAFVTDAQGNPVTDLTREDFEILENGAPQTITSFALVNIPIERSEKPLGAPAPIEPDVQTNDRDEGRVYVIALDEIAGEQALRTRRFLHRFFERYFAANDVAAVVFLGRTNTANTQDFTGNTRLLLQAVDSYTGGFADGPAPTSLAPVPTQPSTLPPPGPAGPGQEATFALRRSMASFRSVVEFLSGVHGRRKALLLFSEGYPIDVFRVIDCRGGVLSLQDEDLHKAITAATRSNVAIYPVDPRGLAPDGGLAESETGLSADATVRQAASLAGMEARQSLRALAQATGGFAVINTNSFESAWDRIVRENSSYYVLGFSSSNERRDGRYRRLQVRVKRPGLQVRGRDGYVAPLRNERPVPAPPPPKDMSVAVAAALGTPLAVSGLPIRVFAAPYKGAAREGGVSLTSVAVSEGLTIGPQNPLAGALPGPITATRDFERGDTLATYAEVYENSKGNTVHDVDLTAELRGEDGRVVVRRTEQRSSSELQGKSGGYGFTASLPLSDIQTGTYIIHVEARSNVEDRPVVSRDILIRVH